MTLDPEWLEILACPACNGPLVEKKDHDVLACERCRLEYPVEDGIPVLIVEKAKRS